MFIAFDSILSNCKDPVQRNTILDILRLSAFSELKRAQLVNLTPYGIGLIPNTSISIGASHA